MWLDKNDRCNEINKSVKRKHQNFYVGQWVYIKNRNKRTKFKPMYLEQPWIIELYSKSGVVVHNPQLTKRKIRHVDDVKPYVKI